MVRTQDAENGRAVVDVTSEDVLTTTKQTQDLGVQIMLQLIISLFHLKHFFCIDVRYIYKLLRHCIFF